MENVMYLDLGEEAVRGAAEKTTIGTIPLLTTNFPVFEPDDRPRGEVRGEETVLGDTLMIRHSTKWSWDFEIPFHKLNNCFLQCGFSSITFSQPLLCNTVTTIQLLKKLNVLQNIKFP